MNIYFPVSICRHPTKVRRLGEDGKETCTTCGKLIQKGRPRSSSTPTSQPSTPPAPTMEGNPKTPVINQLRAKQAIKSLKTSGGIKVVSPVEVRTSTKNKRRVLYDSDEESKTDQVVPLRKKTREEWEEEDRLKTQQEKYDLIHKLLSSEDEELHWKHGHLLEDEDCLVLKVVERRLAGEDVPDDLDEAIEMELHRAENEEEEISVLKKKNFSASKEDKMDFIDDEAEESDPDDGLSSGEQENTWKGESAKKVTGRILKDAISDAGSSSEDDQTDEDEIVDYSGAKKIAKTHKGRRQGGKAWLGGTMFAWREYRKVDYTKGQGGSKVYENFILGRKYNCSKTGKEKNYTFSIPLDMVVNLRKALRDLQNESKEQSEKENIKKTTKERRQS